MNVVFDYVTGDLLFPFYESTIHVLFCSYDLLKAFIGFISISKTLLSLFGWNEIIILICDT